MMMMMMMMIMVVGRYKAGRYPLWGTMYLKWWIVEQIINIMGKGFFRDDLPIIGSLVIGCVRCITLRCI